MWWFTDLKRTLPPNNHRHESPLAAMPPLDKRPQFPNRLRVVFPLQLSKHAREHPHGFVERFGIVQKLQGLVVMVLITLEQLIDQQKLIINSGVGISIVLLSVNGDGSF